MLDEEEWVAAQLAHGGNERMVRFTLGMYQAAAGGWFAGVDPLLPTLLGREPRTARDAIASPPAH